MKKNNKTFYGKKFLIPAVGTYLLAKEFIEISWQTNVKNGFPAIEENFRTGEIALVADIKTYQNGVKSIRVLHNEKVIDIPYNLKKYFYFIKPNDSLKDKNFCITGRLENEREFYQKLIELFGGTYKTNITENIDYLITNGSEKTNKFTKSKELGIKIINEYKFWELLENQRM